MLELSLFLPKNAISIWLPIHLTGYLIIEACFIFMMPFITAI
jgi:hypothetical protein